MFMGEDGKINKQIVLDEINKGPHNRCGWRWF
jgi:hypothetical protein